MKVTKVSLGILKVFRRSRSCPGEDDYKMGSRFTSITNDSLSFFVAMIQMTPRTDSSLIQTGRAKCKTQKHFTVTSNFFTAIILFYNHVLIV